MTQIDLKHLPVGVYVDGSPAYVNLAAGNMMCQGEPGSGKSVMLSALASSILRASPQIVFAILSPKSLDFQNFMGAVKVIQDPEEMLAYLQWVQDQGNIRKQVCLDKHIKKIDKDLWEEYPPIVTMLDEYAMIRNSVLYINGKKRTIGAEIEQKLNQLVAEMRFAAISNIITTQRFMIGSTIDSTLRDNISGTMCSFATNSAATDAMIWKDDSEDAPCYKIKKSQVGCGYIAVGGEKPRAFKGAFADDDDEIAAAEYYIEKRKERDVSGATPMPEFTMPAEDDPEEDEEQPARRAPRKPRSPRAKTAKK